MIRWGRPEIWKEVRWMLTDFSRGKSGVFSSQELYWGISKRKQVIYWGRRWEVVNRLPYIGREGSERLVAEVWELGSIEEGGKGGYEWALSPWSRRLITWPFFWGGQTAMSYWIRGISAWFLLSPLLPRIIGLEGYYSYLLSYNYCMQVGVRNRVFPAIYQWYNMLQRNLYWGVGSRYLLTVAESWHCGPVAQLLVRLIPSDRWFRGWKYQVSTRLRRGLQRVGGRGGQYGLRVLFYLGVSQEGRLLGWWVSSTLSRIPISKHWEFCRLLQRLLDWYQPYLSHFCGIRGLWIQLRGKIGRAGSVRRRCILVGWGQQWWITYGNRFYYSYTPAFTSTGTLGVQVWLIVGDGRWSSGTRVYGFCT